MMKCPECDIKMNEVKTSSHYGIPIVLDQCNSCGGVWFDESELFRTKKGIAHKIDKRLNINKLRNFTASENKFLACPRDGSKLEILKDRFFPKGVQVEVCKKCGGFWFNYGEFVKYQAERKKIQEKMNAQLESGQKKELDNALNKKILNAMKLYHSMEVKQQKRKDKRMLETVGYLIWMLLRMLFFKR